MTADTSNADFYGFQESAADVVESYSKIEALQYLNDPSHEMDQLKRFVILYTSIHLDFYI